MTRRVDRFDSDEVLLELMAVVRRCARALEDLGHPQAQSIKADLRAAYQRARRVEPAE